MPILTRLANFCDFRDFRKAIATAFIAISKISTVNFEISSFYLFQKLLFSSDTKMAGPEKLKLG